jgi:uncharacterized protein (DUF1697 family)
MKTYISLLRGINVSGQKKVNMNDLACSLADLNYKNIKTYIQSGNVIFETEKTEEIILADNIKETILRDFGFQVAVIIRNGEEFVNISLNNPFITERNKELNRLYVTFLATEPDRISVENIKMTQSGLDEFILSGREIYLYCPNGYGKTKLSNSFFEKKLNITATTRNWKTVSTLRSYLEKS